MIVLLGSRTIVIASRPQGPPIARTFDEGWSRALRERIAAIVAAARIRVTGPKLTRDEQIGAIRAFLRQG